MNVDKLKKELSRRNLSTDGKKGILMERLLVDLVEEGQSSDDSFESCSNAGGSPDEGSCSRNPKERERDDGERSYKLLPKDVEGLLPDFTPNEVLSLDAERWVQTVEERMKYLRINERLLMMTVGKKLHKTAKLWYDDIPIEVSTSWSEFRDSFLSAFRVDCSDAIIHEKLRNKMRRKDQDFMEYFYEMKNTSRRRVAEESLVKYIVCGLNDVKLTDTLKTQPIRSMASLKERIDTYSEYNQLCVQTKTKDESDKLKVETSSVAAARQTKPQTSKQERMKECFNCFEKGHFARDCAKPKRPRCEKCHRAGHTTAQCYSKGYEG